jgi:hypothetical protein
MDAGAFGARVAEVGEGGNPDFGGMTVNERLGTAGPLGQFETGVLAGDRRRAVELLGQVGMSNTRAAATVDAVLATPTKYGFSGRPS